jgi:hypothetical protein
MVEYFHFPSTKRFPTFFSFHLTLFSFFDHRSIKLSTFDSYLLLKEPALVSSKLKQTYFLTVTKSSFMLGSFLDSA